MSEKPDEKEAEPEEQVDESDLEDLGEPVSELQTLVTPVPEGFFSRVQNTIRRRELAADMTRFSIWTPALVFMEYIAAFFSAFGPQSTSDSDSEENE